MLNIIISSRGRTVNTNTPVNGSKRPEHPLRRRGDDRGRLRGGRWRDHPRTVHLGLTTDLLKGSTRQNARRALQYYYTYIVEQCDDVHEVPISELTLDSAEQAKAGLTVGAEKHEARR